MRYFKNDLWEMIQRLAEKVKEERSVGAANRMAVLYHLYKGLSGKRETVKLGVNKYHVGAVYSMSIANSGMGSVDIGKMKMICSMVELTGHIIQLVYREDSHVSDEDFKRDFSTIMRSLNNHNNHNNIPLIVSEAVITGRTRTSMDVCTGLVDMTNRQSYKVNNRFRSIDDYVYILVSHSFSKSKLGLHMSVEEILGALKSCMALADRDKGVAKTA